MTVATRPRGAELTTLRERIDRLLAAFPLLSSEAAERPPFPIDVQETEHEVVVTATLPGMRRADITVELGQGQLAISGETREQRDEQHGVWHVRERRLGMLCRTLTLPAPVNEAAARAVFADGVLTVTAPKNGHATRRTLEIQDQ